MQILSFFGILLIIAGICVVLVFTTKKDEEEGETPDPVDTECGDYLDNTKLEGQFPVISTYGNVCEGVPFVIKTMRSQNFFTTDMEGLRPVYIQELQGDVSDTNSVMYALSLYMEDAVFETQGRPHSYSKETAVVNGNVFYNSEEAKWTVADYTC